MDSDNNIPFPILVVDDSAAIRQTVKNTLISMGYGDIHVAPDGAEALKKSREHIYKVVFLDWNMPGMNGLEFLKTFRKEQGGNKCAVIMLTAITGKSEILMAMENGATEYITKPVSTETLKKKMNQAKAWLDAQENKS